LRGTDNAAPNTAIHFKFNMSILFQELTCYQYYAQKVTFELQKLRKFIFNKIKIDFKKRSIRQIKERTSHSITCIRHKLDLVKDKSFI